MTVDVRLLAVLGLPLAYLFALLQLGFWLYRRQRRAHLWWAAANLCAALGATLLVLRDVAPLWVTSSLANTVLLVSGFIIWWAMARFAGRTAPVRVFVMMALLYFGLFELIWRVSDDLGLRVLLASLASAAFNVGIAFELMGAQQQQRLRARALLITVFFVHALFFLFRAGTAVTLDASQDFLQANGIQNLTVAAAVLKLFAWNLGAIWMAREQTRPVAA